MTLVVPIGLTPFPAPPCLQEAGQWGHWPCRFDLDRAVGASGRPVGGDVADAGPWVEFFTWEEGERWLGEGLL